MTKGISIIGTDTEVGKTVVAAGLMHLLIANGYPAAYFKPVASGELSVNGESVPADPALVRAVSGYDEDFKQVTPLFHAALRGGRRGYRFFGANGPGVD